MHQGPLYFRRRMRRYSLDFPRTILTTLHPRLFGQETRRSGYEALDCRNHSATVRALPDGLVAKFQRTRAPARTLG